MISSAEIIEKFQRNYFVRPAKMADAGQVAALLNICSQHLIGLDEWDPGELIADWGDPAFKLEDHSLMVFSEEKLIAYVDFWGISPPYVRHSYMARVHPAFRGNGIGRLLNEWAETKARGFMQLADVEMQVILTCIINSRDECASQLMTDFGSEIVRTTWVMEADLSMEIEPDELPEGHELRIVKPEEIADIYALKVDTFRDHWGSIEIPFDEGLKQFKVHFINEPFYRPDLWFVVAYRGEKVGLVIGNAASSFSSTYGWVNVLGVK
jgi:GNAT superfamily N-acetyltransferase